MKYYRVREWKIEGPKPKPVKVKKGEETPPPQPAPMLSRFRKAVRNPGHQLKDLCDHDHVTRQEADGCPVANKAMAEAGYVGEVSQATRDHAKRQEAHEARVAAAQEKEAEAES